jgi:glycosyltransferase involved in cell wall biosynthesis
VLIIDQGAAFGGSLVVIANLVRCLDPTQFRAVVVAEMDEVIVHSHIRGSAKVYHAKHDFNYVHWQRLSSVLFKVRIKFLRKAGLYLFSLVRRIVNILYATKLAVIMVRERVDLVHINNGTDNFEANLVSLLLARPRIIHVHGIGRVGYLERLFLKVVPKVIVISEFVRSEMLKAGIPDEKMVVIQNPVLPESVSDDASARVREKYGIGEHERIFGVFGRVVQWKGQMEFLRAAALVLAQTQDTKALIVGDISDGSDQYLLALQQFVAQQGIQDRVIFTGYASNVAELYVAMDVVVHTSIAPEPFGLVITEAMAYGVPVVASTLGAPREIIHDKYDGFLVHPADTAGLASVITTLLRDDALRKTIGTRAQQGVLKNYDAKTYAESVEKLYRQVLA